MPTASLPPAPPLTIPSRDIVLWDVVEEHLAEAAFCFEQFEQALDHPSRTLSELDRHPEGRLRAHIDALVIGGVAVRERLLVPELESAASDESARVTAAAITLIEQGCYDDLWPGFSHEDSAIRNATVRAGSLAGDAVLDRWVVSRLTSVSSPATIAALLHLCGARGVSVPTFHKWLRSDDPVLLTAAARAARWADPSTYRAAIEGLLEHPESLVREAAVVSGLCLGSQRAWTSCQRLVLDENATSPLILALCAALGGRDLIAHVARGLDRESDRAAVLFALAFSGDPRQVPLLIEYLRSDNLLHAKLALQAIAAITGLELRDDVFALPGEPVGQSGTDAQTPSDADVAEADAALPPFEEDDLDTNLVPQPEEALPRPNTAAVEQFWKQRAGQFDASRRHLAGSVFSTQVLVRQLECAPLRWRHVLALSLCIRGGPTAWVDTRAWSTTQRVRIAAVRNELLVGAPRPRDAW